MRQIHKLSGLALLVLLAACGNSSGDDTMATDTTIKTVPVTTTVDTGAKPAVTFTTATTPAAPATQATTATGALNPEHGKPGHRCDIAVGAPLNSQPTAAPSTVSPAPATTTAPVVTQTPAAKTAAAPGMNPEHGQPGHRCDIAVGAPLNSKPATTTTTSQPLSLQPSIPAATPVVTPAAPGKAATPVATAAGMNPAHGQPGHRCDIAVGAPLNSKAGTGMDKPKTN